MEEEKSQLKKGVILNYINIGLGNLIPIKAFLSFLIPFYKKLIVFVGKYTTFY